MTSRRPISWFLSDRGRSFSYAFVTGSGIAFMVARFTPHTFFIDNYKDFVRYYRNGKPVDLSKELQDRYQECLDILNISDVHRKLISPFSVFGYDLFHAGASSSKYGMAVGIPVNFKYKSLTEIENDNIQVNQKKIDFTSEIGMKLAEALILPEKVQKFAICREILMSLNNKVLFESIYPFSCIFLVFNFSQYINKKLNLYVAPSYIRGTLYGIVGLFGMGLYFLMKDMTEVYYETEVDKALCELGPEFLESGTIFYEKLLQRNQALRELMGSEGERKYSKLGNENFGLRQPRLALMHRKQFFEAQLKAKVSEILEDSI